MIYFILYDLKIKIDYMANCALLLGKKYFGTNSVCVRELSFSMSGYPI